MKQLLITIAAVVLVGCGESQQSAPAPEVKLVEPSEPVAEAAKPEPPTAKAPDRSIHGVAYEGNIEVVKQHLAAGTDVNAVDDGGRTPLDWAVMVTASARIPSLKVSADQVKKTNLRKKQREDSRKKIVDFLLKHGAKTGEELKTAGN